MSHHPAPSFVQLTMRNTQEPLAESSSGLCLSRKSTRHSYQPSSSTRSPSIWRDAPFCSRTLPGGRVLNQGHTGHSQRSKTRPVSPSYPDRVESREAQRVSEGSPSDHSCLSAAETQSRQRNSELRTVVGSRLKSQHLVSLDSLRICPFLSFL